MRRTLIVFVIVMLLIPIGAILILIPPGEVFATEPSDESLSLEDRIEALEAIVEKQDAKLEILAQRTIDLSEALIGVAEIVDYNDAGIREVLQTWGEMMDFNTALFDKRLDALEEVVFPPTLEQGEHRG